MAVVDNTALMTMNASGLDVKNKKILNVANGSAAQDGAAFGQIAATPLSSFAVPTAPVPWNGQKITGLAAPSPGTTDAANAQYVDEALPAQRRRFGTTFADCVTAQVSATVPFSNGHVSQVGSGGTVTISTTGNTDTLIGYAVATASAVGAFAGVASSISGTAGNTIQLKATARAVFDGLIRVPTLSDGTNTFNVTIGWALDTNHFAQFKVDSNTDTHWTIQCQNGGSLSTTTTSMVLNAGQFYHCKIVWDGSTLTFFIDGTSVGTLNTNVPTASNLFHSFFVNKTLGATPRTAECDWLWTDDIYQVAA